MMTAEDNILMEEKEGAEGQGNKMTSSRLLRGAFICLAVLPRGMTLEIPGPSLPYLRDQVGANLAQVSQVLALRSIGLFVGSLPGGFMFEALPQLSSAMMGVAYVLIAVTLSVMPWTTSLSVLGLMFFLQGFFIGCNIPGVTNCAMAVCNDKGCCMLMAQFLMLGIGGVMMPHVVNAFLTITPLDTDTPTPGSNNTSVIRELTEAAGSNREEFLAIQGVIVDAALQYPFLITAAVNVCAAIGFGVYQWVDSKHEKMSKNNKIQSGKDKSLQKHGSFVDSLRVLSPGSCTNGQPMFGLVYFVFLTLLFMHIFGTQNLMSKFVYTYMLGSNLGFSVQEAANINTFYWVGIIVGRCLNVLGAAWLPPRTHFPSEVALGMVTSIALFIWGEQSKLTFTILTCLFGLSMPSLLPLGLAWADLYVNMTVGAVGLAYFGCGIGAASYQALAGYLFDYYGTWVYLYFVLAGMINITVVFVILQVLSSVYSQKNTPYTALD